MRDNIGGEYGSEASEDDDEEIQDDDDSEDINDEFNEDLDEGWDPGDDSDYEDEDVFDENWNPGDDSEYENKGSGGVSPPNDEKEDINHNRKIDLIEEEEDEDELGEGLEDYDPGAESQNTHEGAENDVTEENSSDLGSDNENQKIKEDSDQEDINEINEEIKGNYDKEKINEIDENWDLGDDSEYEDKDVFDEYWDPGDDSEYEHKVNENIEAKQRTITIQQEEGIEESSDETQQASEESSSEKEEMDAETLEPTEKWPSEKEMQLEILEEEVEELFGENQENEQGQEIKNDPFEDLDEFINEVYLNQINQEAEQEVQEEEYPASYTEGFKGNAKKLDYEGTSAPTEEEIEQESLRDTAEEISERFQEQIEETAEEANEILSKGFEEICEQQQERERIEEQEHQQGQEQVREQKEKPQKLNAKKMKVITDREELENYDQYESIPVLRGDYSQEEKSARETRTEQKEKQMPEKHNAKKMVIITEKEDLKHYDHSESISPLRGDYEQEQTSKQKSKAKNKQKKHNAKNMELYIYEQEVQEAEKEKIEEVNQEIKKEQERINEEEKEEEKDIKADENEQFKQQYHEETGGRAIYGEKETKGFTQWKEEKAKEREQEIKNHQNSANQARDYHRNENRWELREPEPSYIITYDYANQMDLVQEVYEDKWVEWAYQLEDWISRRDYSERVKADLLQKLYKFQRALNIYQKRSDLVEELRQYYRDTVQKPYYELNKEKELKDQINTLTRELNDIDSLEYSLFQEFKTIRDKFYINHKKSQNELILDQMFNGNNSIIQNFKEILKENLYKSTEISMKEKQKIVEIIQKEKFSENDKNILISILEKLTNEELNELLLNKVNEYITIRDYQIKLEIIGKYFEGKCLECDTNIRDLPVLQFHHLDPEKKMYSYRDLKGRSLEVIAKKLIKENTTVLCSNHHLMKQAKIYLIFRNIIEERNLFHYSPERIDEIINQNIENYSKTTNFQINFKNSIEKNSTAKVKSKIKSNIKRWIRKRYILETLFKGRCIGCGLQIYNNLPMFELHHKDFLNKEEEKNKYHEIANFDCKTIATILIEQKCVGICSNCHSIIHAKFHLLSDEILGDNFNATIKRKYKLYIKEKFNKITKNIQEFNFEVQKTNIKSPLKLIFPQENTWKINLMEVYNYINKNQVSSFKIKDIADCLAIEKKIAYRNVGRLISRNLVEVVELPQIYKLRYKLSKFGIAKAELIKKDKPYASKIIESKIKPKKIILNDSSIERESHIDILQKYSIAIQKIINKNGYNEFLIKELDNHIKRGIRDIRTNINYKLIPEGYVKIIKNPIFTDTPKAEIVYKLTKKGKELVNSLNIKLKDENNVNISSVNINNKLAKFSVILYKLIQKKGYNEFVFGDLLSELGIYSKKNKEYKKIEGIMYKRLKPNEIVKVVEDPNHLKPKRNERVYKLSEKGFELAKKVQDYFNI